MNITDVSLGFCKNVTLKYNLEENYSDFNTESIINSLNNKKVNLKLVIECNADDKDAPFIKRIIESVRESESVNKLIVIYNVIKKTNVRSKTIIEAKTNTDKLKEYCIVNGIKFTKGLEEKLKSIEENLNIKYFHPNKTFTLLRLDLRGSIGIKEGSGKDEVSVDFRDFIPGIVYLTGENGCGKSTLLENMSPYPRLLTRSGKLQDHFFHKDSYRKLLYKDNDGCYYRIEMLIDGKSKNGKVKYLVYTGKDLNCLQPVSDCDGNSDSYDNWVERTFGSIELFLRTSFFTKEQTSGIPDLSKATKGDKKELFSTLLGLNGLSDISVSAKQNIEPLTELIDNLKLLEERKKVVMQGIEDAEEIIEGMTISLKESDKIIKEHDKEIKKLEEEISKLSADTSITEKKQKLESLSDIVETLNETKNEIKEYEEKKELYDKVLKAYENIKTLEDTREGYREEKEATLGELSVKQREVNRLENQLGILETEIKTFTNSSTLEINDKCPTCNQTLPDNKLKELKEEVEKNLKFIKDKQREKTSVAKKLASAKKNLDILNLDIEGIDFNYNSVNGVIEKLKKDTNGLTVQFINYMTDKYNKNKTMDLSSLSAMESEIEKLKSDIALSENKTDIEREIQGLKDEIEDITSDKEDAIKERDEELQELGAAKERLESYMKEKESFTDNKKRLETATKDLEEYSILTKAFGKNGIQALELEALSPEIAEITNSILRSAYGDRFSVSFQTLREGSAGNVIEDFKIIVSDSDTGTERPLEWLSSGEAIWIKEALYNAFTAIRIKSTGFSFRTRFLDETDGSLDESKRMMFLKMLQATHDAGDVEHTVLITHSQELKDIITQRIKI